MVSATAYSICDICGERHARGAPHVWKDAASKSSAPAPSSIPAEPAKRGSGSVNSPRRRSEGRAEAQLKVRSEKRDAGAGESPAPPTVDEDTPTFDPNCPSCVKRKAIDEARVKRYRARQKETT
jgi:hypothetical protein